MKLRSEQKAYRIEKDYLLKGNWIHANRIRKSGSIELIRVPENNIDYIVDNEKEETKKE